MIYSSYQGIRLAGLSCCVPSKTVSTSSYAERFGADKVDKFVKMSGVTERHVAAENQTASDMAYIAASKLLEAQDIDASSVGVLIFVTQTADYEIPASAFVLQKRLGVSSDAICFDINLGCTGFASGLNTAASILASSDAKRGLLLFGDTLSRKVSPDDRAECMLFGDGGGALLLEKDESAREITTACRSDGESYDMGCIPAGGARHPQADATRRVADDGNIRGPYDFYMDGVNLFFYSTTDAVNFLQEYMNSKGLTAADYDYLILHQANGLIMKTFMKRVGFTEDKVPVSIDRYGNTAGSSVPITIADALGAVAGGGMKRCLMCGFGVGMSCALVDAYIDPDTVLPIIESDSYYEGTVA